MGVHPVHIPQPEEYWIYDQLLEQYKPTMSFIQFIPGVVVGVVTARDSGKYDGDLRRISSIRAMPHFGQKGQIKKKSMVGEESRYYPLLRGIQETPVTGDPVLLCELGGVQYYLGPLNTQGKPNFNEDKFKDDELRSGIERGMDPTAEAEKSGFIKKDVKRLQKFVNPPLDNPKNPDGESAKVIHGDLVLEGRHGNSLRIGSRNVNPYLIISNNRVSNNPIETTLDGTIMAMLKHGTIRQHFNMDKKEDKKYEFILADDEKDVEPDIKRSISKTFTKGLGRGLVDKPENDDTDINKTIYEYNQNQFFLSSDRITFNAKNESIFMASKEFTHIGAGNTITISTSNNILMEAGSNIRVRNTPLVKINAGEVYVDGRDMIMLGDPLLGDIPNNAVIGNGLVLHLVSLISVVKSLASSTASAIENRAKAGFSLKKMMKIQEECDKLLGTNNETGLPEGLENQILSKRVYNIRIGDNFGCRRFITIRRVRCCRNFSKNKFRSS